MRPPPRRPAETLALQFWRTNVHTGLAGSYLATPLPGGKRSLRPVFIVHDALGDGARAMEKLSAALSLGRRGGFIRTFVDLGPPMADLLRRYRLEDLAGRNDTAPYVDRILAAFEPETDREQATPTDPSLPSIQPAPAPSAGVSTAGEPIELLTGRELDVLELLAQRLTYKEIGAKLVISPGTVGQHAVRIYGKLGVNNRRQAVAKARALGLLQH